MKIKMNAKKTISALQARRIRPGLCEQQEGKNQQGSRQNDLFHISGIEI